MKAATSETGGARRVLALDAAGTAVVGTAYLAAAAPLGRLFGPSTTTVAAVGAAMLAMGLAIAALARRPHIPRAAVRAVIGAGACWILLSLAVLALGALDLTTTGVVWTWLQMIPVGVFAMLQTMALGRTSPTRPATKAADSCWGNVGCD
ncbi:hypothetical protein ACFWZ2_40555 [Streptomyces sp. NPDC059002]|uniref:hypothetical protein n=1 Tax=Streptomyces sp. NPDC059002 TaxID=3346690 RepID=UPI0036C063E6